MLIQLLKEFMGRKIGERIDVSETDANALVAQQIAQPVTDDIITPAVQKAMEQAFSGFQKGLDAFINASLKQFQDAQARSRRGAVPAIFGEGNDGDPHGRTFGDWLVQFAILGSHMATPQAKAAAQDRVEKVYASNFTPWQKAAMAESSGTTGGYTVPPDFYQQLLAVAAEENTFRQLQFGFVQPMASVTLQFPFLDITTAQAAGNFLFFDGVIANWTSECQTRCKRCSRISTARSCWNPAPAVSCRRRRQHPQDHRRRHLGRNHRRLTRLASPQAAGLRTPAGNTQESRFMHDFKVNDIVAY